MQKVTLGGERLGSGNKMKVDFKTYDRSTHDLSEIFRSTMSPGTIVPFYKKLCLPGDRWEIELDINMLTHPTIGPLFGSYKVQLDAFITPIRLYQAKLHMNMINIGRNMGQIKLPLIRLDATEVEQDDPNIDISQVNPSCLLAYLGIRGIGMRNNHVGSLQRYFNAVPLLAYWEIVKQYYTNKQEEIGAVIHSPAVALVNTLNAAQILPASDPSTPTNITQLPATTSIYINAGDTLFLDSNVTSVVPEQIMLQTIEYGIKSAQELFGPMTQFGIDWKGTINGQYVGITIEGWRYQEATDIAATPPNVVTFPLENIDTMRQIILTEALSPSAFIINELASPQLIAPYSYLNGYAGNLPYKMCTQEGLAVKTYQSDVNNNWLNTEWIDGVGGISEITAIDTSSGEFTMDQLNLSKKVYDMLNRIAVSGGTYKDWIDVTYTESGAWRADNPVYLGSLIKEMVFQEVVSNSASTDQPLGTIAGKGVLSQKHKGGYINFSVDEPSYLMMVVSITPRVDYSQGNDWDMHLLTMDDFHKPALDGIGFQELITENLAWWDTSWNAVSNVWEVRSAGKQPAWINYMTSVNKTYGNFAIPTNEMFMTLNRRYEAEPSGADVTIKDLTTYIDPVKYNTIFANTSIDAQNFWCQIRTDAKARRVMSGKLMPTM